MGCGCAALRAATEIPAGGNFCGSRGEDPGARAGEIHCPCHHAGLHGYGVSHNAGQHGTVARIAVGRSRCHCTSHCGAGTHHVTHRGDAVDHNTDAHHPGHATHHSNAQRRNTP